MSVNPTQKPRDMFRWAFEEQLRNRIHDSVEVNNDSYTQNLDRINAAAMDAFDYVWRRYGLDQLDIRPGRP